MLKPSVPSVLFAALALGAMAVGGGARAEKADRQKPMTIEADKQGSTDMQRNVVVFTGNVVVSQGSMQIRAERIEIKELPDGHRVAMATGLAGKPVAFKQRRDVGDETVEGQAERIEYDTQSNQLRLNGYAAVKRLRGAAVLDEITGAAIVWDNTSEQFSVQGGAPTPSNPTGRVRAVLAPPGEGAKPAAPAASAATTAPLKTTRSLGEPR